MLRDLLSFEIDLCEVLDILDGFFQVGDFVHVDGEQSIQGNLPVDVGLALHEAARVGLWAAQTLLDGLLFFLPGLGLLLCEILWQALIVDLDGELTNDAVGTLTVSSPVEENDTIEHRLLVFSNVASLTLVKILHQIGQVLHRQLSVSNHKLSVVLVERQRDVEQVIALSFGCFQLLVIAEQIGYLVLLGHQISVHSVHRDRVIEVGRLGGGLVVNLFLNVVRFEYFILIEREGILDGHVLDVAARDEVLLILIHILLLVLSL